MSGFGSTASYFIDTSSLLIYLLTAERSRQSEHLKQAFAVKMAYRQSEGLDFLGSISTDIAPHSIQEYDKNSLIVFQRGMKTLSGN